MGIFSNIFGTEMPDPLLPKAEQLVDVARVQAMSLHTVLLDFLNDLANKGEATYDDFLDDLLLSDTEHWNLILTVAGIFIAASRLNHLGISDTRKKGLMRVIAERVQEWRPDGVDCFNDCKTIFEQNYDLLATEPEYQNEPRFLGSDSLGIWIVWNLIGHAPSSEVERRLVRMLGGTVTSAFCDWWEA